MQFLVDRNYKGAKLEMVSMDSDQVVIATEHFIGQHCLYASHRPSGKVTTRGVVMRLAARACVRCWRTDSANRKQSRNF